MTRNKIKQINFEGQIIYTGFDVHKKDVQLKSYLDSVELSTVRLPYDKQKIVSYLHKTYPGAIHYSAYEAGFSGYSLHNYLLASGIHNIVVNAADVPMSNKEKEQKTDKRDAQQIAKCLRAGLLESIYIPDEQQLSDRALARYRDKIVIDLSRIRNRIKMFLHFFGYVIPKKLDKSYWSRNFITWLNNLEIPHLCCKTTLDMMLDQFEVNRKWLLKINRDLRSLIKERRYKNNYELLLSVCGVGCVTAWCILTELGDTSRFSNKDKLCSYVGLIPNSRSSGEKEKKGRITNRAHVRLRSKLIEAAWVAIRHDPALALAYNKMVVRGKIKPSRAIVSIARKLLCRIRAVLISGVKYQKNIVE